MKKNLLYGVSIMALMFTTTACGGGEEETTEESSEETTEEVEEVEEVVEAVTYEVDTAASTINWYSMDGEEKAHYGTVGVMEGSYTQEGDMITGGNLKMDMNTITVDDEMGGEKLQGHLMSADFFDVNQFASAEFTIESHEDGMINGTLNAAGQEFAVTAPVTVGEGTVEIQEFKIEMVTLPFFQTEREEAPEEEWHNPMIGISGTISAK